MAGAGRGMDRQAGPAHGAARFVSGHAGLPGPRGPADDSRLQVESGIRERAAAEEPRRAGNPAAISREPGELRKKLVWNARGRARRHRAVPCEPGADQAGGRGGWRRVVKRPGAVSVAVSLLIAAAGLAGIALLF